MQDIRLLNILVNNNFGVLSRITSLFGRKGFNIDSLTVSRTDNPNISRITITLKSSSEQLQQFVAQTKKLEEVKEVEILDPFKTIMREIIIVKVKINDKIRRSIIESSNIFGAEIINLTKNTLIVQFIGNPSKVDSFLEILEEFEILEVSRTGVTAMKKN